MSYLNTKERYGTLSIALHWLMVLLFIGVYAAIEFSDSFPKGSETRGLLKSLHFSFGMSILILVWLRLIARLIAPTPDIVPAIPAWQHMLSKLIHLVLYIFMIAMPLAGYIGRMLAGKVTYLFGIALPVFLDVNKDLAENIFDVHETIGNISYFLIGLHVVAALFHHYFMRDNTLTRMLPKRA